MFGDLVEEAFDELDWDEPLVVVPGDPEVYPTPSRGRDEAVVDVGVGTRRGTGLAVLRVPDSQLADEGQQLEAGRQGGLDRFAWYVSHHFGLGWGIYIREAGAVALGRELAARNHSDPWTTGLDLLYLHELLHAGVDAAVTTVELVVRSPLYVPRLRVLRQDSHPWDSIEEGLANAHALRMSTKASDRTDAVAVASLLAEGPEGYRDFARYQTKDRWRAGYAELMSRYATPRRQARLPGTEWLIEGALREKPDVPVHLVRDYPGPPVFGFIRQIERVREDRQFEKSLRKLPQPVQESWTKALEQLSESTQHPGLRFKPLKGQPGYFSVRVGRGYRAVLRWSEGGWEAIRLEPRQGVY